MLVSKGCQDSAMLEHTAKLGGVHVVIAFLVSIVMQELTPAVIATLDKVMLEGLVTAVIALQDKQA